MADIRIIEAMVMALKIRTTMERINRLFHWG